jgi:hypothetical protein
VNDLGGGGGIPSLYVVTDKPRAYRSDHEIRNIRLPGKWKKLPPGKYMLTLLFFSGIYKFLIYNFVFPLKKN